MVQQTLYIRDQNGKNNPLLMQELSDAWILQRCHANVDGASSMGGVRPEVQFHLKTRKSVRL